jgi:hypothetical protein
MRDDPFVADLVTRARKGDQQAWDVLVERYSPLIWSICRHYRLSRAAERHEALREAFTYLSPSRQQLMAMLIEDPPVPYTEISARLGIPVSSIGPTRRRCLDQIRHHPAIAALISAEDGLRRDTQSWANRRSIGPDVCWQVSNASCLPSYQMTVTPQGKR